MAKTDRRGDRGAADRSAGCHGGRRDRPSDLSTSNGQGQELGADPERATAATRPGQWTQWTEARKRSFLDALVATCNVKAAAHAAGVDPTAVYRLRQRDAAFSAGWAVALDAGFQLLETQLLGQALALSGAVTEADGIEMPDRERDFEPGFRMLRHRAALRERRPMKRTEPRLATREETDAAILRKLDILAKRGRPS
ncbi:MAG TPA: hypothetical protein VM900_01370 [Sphingomonas sp.]|nr:hypothetical protein [Sphingomonas sp.]